MSGRALGAGHLGARERATLPFNFCSYIFMSGTRVHNRHIHTRTHANKPIRFSITLLGYAYCTYESAVEFRFVPLILFSKTPSGAWPPQWHGDWGGGTTADEPRARDSRGPACRKSEKNR